MRVAIVAQPYPPMVSGAAVFAERLANHFSTDGYQILVWAASERPYPYREDKPNLRVERCRSYYNPLRVGQRVALWPHREMSQALAEFSPQIIHLQDPFQFALTGLLFAHRRKIPVILTIHQLPWFIAAYVPGGKRVGRLVEAVLWRYARWILNQCTYAVVGSQTIADLITAQTRITPRTISMGVDVNLFAPRLAALDDEPGLRARLGLPQDAPIILHVGRLDKDKRADRVVRAAAQAMEQTPAHLLVVGDGTERANLVQLCARLGIAGRSHFPGFVSVQDGLPALYRMATVFVIASEIETQGLVLLEAAACGLPIVGVRASCLHEIVHEGENGFLAPPGDCADMARRIVDFVKDPAWAREMGQKGRAIAQCHSIENMFLAYDELYHAAVEASNSVFECHCKHSEAICR